jgi:hypothetical protein
MKLSMRIATPNTIANTNDGENIIEPTKATDDTVKRTNAAKRAYLSLVR